MKNKPLRHKEKNTFKFEPFSQRIANIKIDVFHKVAHKYDTDDEETTHFNQALEKWSLLNLSDSFEQLRSELVRDVKILPQLLTVKDEVVSVLLKHLEKRDRLNIQCVLELIVALAKDLRHEFHPYFLSVYRLLVPLAESRQPDVIEWTFQTLAYLFKFLWRPLVTSMLNEVFESLLPLLSSSKPIYLNHFAAQSFAFLARKVKEPARLVKLIVHSARKFPDGVEGCGRLVFEIVNGVPGQFHSYAEAVLDAFLDNLKPQGVLYSVLSSCFKNIFKEIHVDHLSLCWKTLLDKLKKFRLQWEETKNAAFCEVATQILTFMRVGVSFKNGASISNPQCLVEALLVLLEPQTACKPWTEIVIEILSAVLMSPVLKLTQELSSRIVTSAMGLLKDDDLIKFVNSVKLYSGFEGLVLAQLLKFCSGNPPLQTLPVLADLVLTKRQLSMNFEELSSWTVYPLDFTSSLGKNAADYINTFISVLEDAETGHKHCDQIANVLLVLPNVLPLDRSRAISAVNGLIERLSRDLAGSDGSTTEPAILALSIETLAHLKPEGGLTKSVSPDAVLTALLEYCSAEHLCILRALDFYVCCDELKLLKPHVPEIHKRVIPLIGSPYHKVRELAVHIVWNLELLISDAESFYVQLLKTAYLAENTPASISEYREKLKYFQKLSCINPTVNEMIKNGEVDGKIFLRVLLGSLYINFKLIWDPLLAHIITYSQSLAVPDFWSVFHSYLIDVVKCIEQQTDVKPHSSKFEAPHLQTMSISSNDLAERPDHINCRILLLKILEDSPSICEIKNKDVVALFLTFMNEEYFKRNADAAVSWDVTNRTDDTAVADVGMSDESVNIDTTVNEGVTTLDNSQFDAPIEKGKPDESASSVQNVTGDLDESNLESKEDDLAEREVDFDQKYRLITKSLLSHLAIFSKLRSPKSLHREQELYKIYIDFLAHKLPDVQRAALDCILTYKFKYLLPYKENLYGLIDDKTFKNEVSLFRIDTESNIVKPEHRPDLIPLVLRIVYSKLYTKSANTKGQNKQARKSTVIRFLAGCSKLELESFFHMAFSLFHEWASSEDLLSTLDQISLSIDLKNVISPRRLQSAVYLLNTIVVYCGGLLGPEQLGYLLRVSLSAMAHITGIFQNRNAVYPSYLRTLRAVRTTCFEILGRFYKSYESYPWSASETEAVFKVYVWPYLNKLPIEGIHSPTAQLRLFTIWSRNPRYFVLLGKTHDEDKTLSPIGAMMDLWLNKHTQASVSSAIMDAVQNLMTIEDFTVTSNTGLIGGDVVTPLEVSHPAVLDSYGIQALPGGEMLNYGSKILLPFVHVILERLKRKLESKRNLDRKEREVMSRVTEMVSDPVSSEALLELLFPTLLKKSEEPDDVIAPLLTTVYNLIKNVDKPGRYVRKLAPLYCSVASPSLRKLLFSIVIALSKQEGSESGLDDQLLDDLNAWDAKWVDQPDFARRLSAFSKLGEMADAGTISTNLGVIVIYTCFHFMKVEKDLSLRDNAKLCLEKVCTSMAKQVADDPKEKNYVLDNIILAQIRSGFNAKFADNVRNDCISLLGILARECSGLHPVLTDLSHLANKQDPEVDFFENIRHLQLHRRVRAMLKFSSVVKAVDQPFATRTLTQFILPIVSHYLVSEKYHNKNTIVDSAIAALGSVCLYLPWYQYQTLLLYYVGKLQSGVDYQRQVVRILVEILNAFHFDLTKGDLSILNEVRGVLPNGENENGVGEPAEAEVKKDDTSGDNPGVQVTDGTIIAEDAEKPSEETILETELDLEDATETERAVQEQNVKSEIMILSPRGATKVINVITKMILPQLNKVMAQKTKSETHHKLNRRMTGPDQDEEDILKVPLAVAAVKLLQKLPSPQFLEINLPGIFMKLCTFLKSRLESVRKVTRETLQTIMVSLGPNFLPTLVHEMRSLLTRGYQIHVLVYSIHSVLVPLEPHFQKGQLDKCAHSIIDLCRMDLFGRASEEKEVNQIVGKVLEARSTRSFDTFRILSKYVSEQYLLDILLPMKEELSRTMSHKYVNKVRLALEQIVLGLTENVYLPSESLLMFAYGTSSESVPALVVDVKDDKKLDLKKIEFEARQASDCFLIPQEPKKAKVVEGVNTCARTNSHLLVEFGFRLFYFLLKREKVKEKKFIPQLDPFVSLLKDALNSQHVKVGTLAAKCLTWVLKMQLPSLKSNIKAICDILFNILHKFACAGLSKGDNFDLVLVTFNAVACIVRDVKYHRLNPDQLRTLILYCEQDIEDTSRQTTAFSLLKAIISLKTNTPELRSVMKKVAAVSIKAFESSVRLQARQIVYNYIMQYSLGKIVENFLSIYFHELNYEYLSGRESALEMVANFTHNFPIAKLNAHAPAIFVNVTTVLENDSEPSCRKAAADIIADLLSRLDGNGRSKLFDITLVWLKTKHKLAHRKLAAQLIGIFVTTEKADFEPRLKILLPPLIEAFVSGGETKKEIGRFVKAPQVVDEQENTSKTELDRDHFLFQLLHTIVKMATHIPEFLKKTEYTADVETIADHAISLLGHPHQWVRHSAVQLIGLVLTSYEPKELAAAANDPSHERQQGFLLKDTRSRLKSLAHDVIAQLIPSEEINEKFLMQCMKLLTYLAEIIKDIEPAEGCKLTVLWLVRMVQKMVNYEIVNAPSSIIVRTMAFNFAAAISLKLSREELSPVAVQLLKPIARQLNVDDEDPSLKRAAREASNYIKKKIGLDLYNETMAKLSNLMDIKRAERKKQQTQLMVTNPERAAKRKIDKNLKKREAQKKKIKQFKMQTYKRKKKNKDLLFDD